MRQTRPWPLAAVILALLAVAMPAQAQTLVGALGAASVASSLQGIGSNAAAIGLGAANNAVNNLGGRRPAPAVPTVASGTASTRPANTGGTTTTARPAPATTPARPATQPATPARPATTPARPAPTPATPRPTGGTANNNTGTNNNANNNGGTNNGTNGNANNGNANNGTGGTNGTGNGAQTGGGRGAGYTANLTNNGYGRGVRGGTATASLGGRTLTPLRPVFNATAMGQTLRDARINIRMGFANISSTTPAAGNATARP